MSPELFSEFGLAGAVIAALFFTIGVLSKTFLSHLEKVTSHNKEHVDAILETHRSERKAWSEEETKRSKSWADQEMKRAEIFRSSLDRAVDRLVVVNNDKR